MKSETRWKFNGILRTMVVALILTMVLPFWGQGNSGYSFAGDSVGYKLVFIDSQTGRTIATKEGSAKPGDKIGPEQEIQVRDTYYDKSSGTDYDLDTSAENSPLETRISSDKDKNVFTYHYTKHAQKAVEITFNCVTKDNMKVLKSESKKVSPEKKGEYTAPETIKENGKIYKAAGQRKISVDYKNLEKTEYNIPYVEASSDNSYYVRVNYVAGSKLVQSTGFNVDGTDYYFAAPSIFSQTDENGNKTYYEFAGDSDQSNVIHHKAGSDVREYNLKYKAFDNKSGYTWYILLYDGSTNTTIGQKEVGVKPGETATFKPEENLTIDGKKFNLSSASDKELKHVYGERDRVTYVYYEPEGWNPEKHPTTITVTYRNLKDDSVIETRSMTCKPDQKLSISLPDKLSKNGHDYELAGGQSSAIDHSYYSPVTNYTVYYRDVEDTNLAVEVITQERNEITVVQGPDKVTMIPGTVRYVAVNRSTGTSRNLGATDSTGRSLGVTDRGSSSGAGKNDQAMDGVKADEIKTPKGNIDLKKNSGMSTAAIAGAAVLIIAAIGAFVFMMMRRRNRKGSEEN